MTHIYLIRHGEAEGNLFRVAHGQYNSTLTPRGYRQLAYLRRRFENVALDAVYGSDLLRAHATASALYVPRGLAFRPMPLLREVCLGCWEQRSWGEIERMDPAMYVDFNKRPDLWQVAGAESFARVRERMLEAVRLLAAAHPGGTVAATSHGAALRTLLGTLEGRSLAEIGQTGHGDNTAVSLLEVEGDQIRVVFRDDASHVPPEASTFHRQSWHKSDAATEPGLWFRTCRQQDSSREEEALLGEAHAGRVAMALEGRQLVITDYEVAPALRGRHFGVQLLGQAVQYARSQGRERVALRCPEELSGYFAQFGFRETGRQGGQADLALDIRLVIRDVPAL